MLPYRRFLQFKQSFIVANIELIWHFEFALAICNLQFELSDTATDGDLSSMPSLIAQLITNL